jgi:hypothetical protein
MGALLKSALVYVLATLPFAWQIQSNGRAIPDALVLGLRAPYDALLSLSQGAPVALVPLGAFIFIMFIGLTVVWQIESSRN